MKKKLKLVLLVDDNADDNFFHRRVLEKADICEQIDEVYNGKEALEYLTNTGQYASLRADFPQPDLIFLDINMPLMDGWELMEAYGKLDDGVKGGVIIVMLTTSKNPNDQIKSKSVAPVGDFLTKPLTFEAVDAIFRKYFP